MNHVDSWGVLIWDHPLEIRYTHSGQARTDPNKAGAVVAGDCLSPSSALGAETVPAVGTEGIQHRDGIHTSKVIASISLTQWAFDFQTVLTEEARVRITQPTITGRNLAISSLETRQARADGPIATAPGASRDSTGTIESVNTGSARRTSHAVGIPARAAIDVQRTDS